MVHELLEASNNPLDMGAGLLLKNDPCGMMVTHHALLRAEP